MLDDALHQAVDLHRPVQVPNVNGAGDPHHDLRLAVLRRILDDDRPPDDRELERTEPVARGDRDNGDLYRPRIGSRDEHLLAEVKNEGHHPPRPPGGEMALLRRPLPTPPLPRASDSGDLISVSNAPASVAAQI
ncbi:hypothetical protein [Nonomuraea bangladeshensis]|uniref:hypothetical protein n=1 Tax=Nonomuraea bangladeshensis TaxID=404385 RepID=UPI0031DF6CEB